MWVAMTRSAPKSQNMCDIALYQPARMNFNNLQQLQLSKPNSPSISEAPSEFRLPAPFILDKESLPPTRELTISKLDQIPELAPADACSFLLSVIPGYRDSTLQPVKVVNVKFLEARFNGGIRKVQGEKDPLSNMWTGPV